MIAGRRFRVERCGRGSGVLRVDLANREELATDRRDTPRRLRCKPLTFAGAATSLQPALEQLNCQRVGAPKPIPNCTRPSRAYRKSFWDATVQEIAIEGDRAAARFSNGETIELQRGGDDRGWLVDKLGENAGRGFFK